MILRETWFWNQNGLFVAAIIWAEIKSLFNASPSRIVVIPNGVSMSRSAVKDFSLNLETEGINDRDQVIFYIGRLVREKGVTTLIRAFLKISQEMPSAKLIIGGQGPQASELQELVEELDLNDRVWFTGYVSEELRDWIYRRANVAVFPSLRTLWHSGFRSHGLWHPVIVSDVGGLAEIVSHGNWHQGRACG